MSDTAEVESDLTTDIIIGFVVFLIIFFLPSICNFSLIVSQISYQNKNCIFKCFDFFYYNIISLFRLNYLKKYYLVLLQVADILIIIFYSILLYYIINYDSPIKYYNILTGNSYNPATISASSSTSSSSNPSTINNHQENSNSLIFSNNNLYLYSIERLCLTIFIHALNFYSFIFLNFCLKIFINFYFLFDLSFNFLILLDINTYINSIKNHNAPLYKYKSISYYESFYSITNYCIIVYLVLVLLQFLNIILIHKFFLNIFYCLSCSSSNDLDYIHINKLEDEDELNKNFNIYKNIKQRKIMENNFFIAKQKKKEKIHFKDFLLNNQTSKLEEFLEDNERYVQENELFNPLPDIPTQNDIEQQQLHVDSNDFDQDIKRSLSLSKDSLNNSGSSENSVIKVSDIKHNFSNKSTESNKNIEIGTFVDDVV